MNGTSVSPVVSGSAEVVFGENNWATRIQSVTPDYESIEDWQIADSGNFAA